MAAAARPPLPLRWTRAAQPAFVGRRPELLVLEEVWSRVLAGTRQVVVVGGEPGAGKSRLLAQAGAVLHHEGACVLVGTCVPDLGLPYQPFVEPVEALLGAAAGEELAGLRVVAGRSASPGSVAEPEHRRQVYASTLDALVRRSREQPVVLVLEDVHWAGPAALELLTYLVERCSEARLLVLATHRTTAPDRSSELVTAISRLYRLDGVRRLDLDGLLTEDIAVYLHREAGLPPARARSAAAVLRDQTGGNPFFLRELWRQLSASGGVSALHRADPAAPASVRDALQSRLLHLLDPQRQTLELAAVIGEEVDVATVLAASDWSREATLSALDDGVAYGLLEELAPGTYRFPHALARQAVVDLLPASRRAHQHAKVARVLEARSAGTPGRVQALAHHYGQAHALGFADKAVHYLVEAARSAARALAHEDAAHAFEQAAGICDDTARREELLLAAARSHLLGGDFSRSRALSEQVAATTDHRCRLQAAVLFEAASWRPGLPGARAVELLRGALADPACSDDDPLAVRALASLGRALAFTGDTDAAAEIGAAAVRTARLLGDDALLAHSLQASLWHGLRPQDAPAKLARATELSELAQRTGDLGQLGPAAYYRGVISYVQADPEGWAAAAVDLRRMSQATGQGFFEYMAGCLDYGRQFVAGSFAAASRTCEALLELGERFGTDGTEGPSAVQTFMVRRETGQVEQVRRLITGSEQPDAHWAPGLLALYTELGLDEPASRLLRELLADGLVRYRDSAQWPAVLAFLTEAALHLGNAAAAEQLADELAPYSGHNLVAGQFVALFGSADRYLGAVESLLGRPDADQRLVAALALDRRTVAPVHVAHTLTALVVHRRRAGPVAGLDELVRQAREMAELLGLVRSLRLLGPLRSVPQQRPAGLTTREAEVLCLLGEGLSNREIAERLVISEHTAANHVRSILAKTGSGNRTQAAMYAAEHDLLR
jgi:DNA-binding CsgD family transcriptional regulator